MPRQTAAPSKEILEAALQGLEAQKQKLDEQITQVRGLLGSGVRRPGGGSARTASSGGAAPAVRKKRALSPEARKRIAAAQKKRWAAFRKSHE